MSTFIGPYFHFCLELTLETKTFLNHSLKPFYLPLSHLFTSVKPMFKMDCASCNMVPIGLAVLPFLNICAYLGLYWHDSPPPGYSCLNEKLYALDVLAFL